MRHILPPDEEREEGPGGGPRQMQSFDYHHGHQSMEEDFRDDGPPAREIFDYNHRPPPWNMHHPPPPHLPPGPIDPQRPPGPFPWGPPPPGPPPPDFPPPIPYFDLPAGLMVAVVPVSVSWVV